MKKVDEDFRLEEYLENENFRRWLLAPDPQTIRYWKNWLKANPDQAPKVEAARNALLQLVPKESLTEEDKETIWKRIERSKSTGTKTHTLPIANKRRLVAGLAACLTLLIVFSSVYLSKDSLTSEAMAPGLVEKVNQPGQNTRIFLPDGSKVHLGPDSKLTYQDNFGSDKRSVQLKGLAYFEVISDSLRPFSVHTGDITTTVMGTAFNINSYPENPLKVSLIHGKVRVADSLEKMDLLPGQNVVYDPSTRALTLGAVNEEEVAWTQGIITFKSTNLIEAIQELERWYGVSVSIKGDIPSGLTVSGKFDNDYLSNVLTSLGHAVNFDHHIDGKYVEIFFKETQN